MAAIWIHMIYGVPSMVFYFYIFYLRLRMKEHKLGGAFNTIFLTASAVVRGIFKANFEQDWLTYVASIFILRLPLTGMFSEFFISLNNFGVWLAMCYLLVNYLFYVMYTLLLLLAVNRFIAVFLPTYYDQVSFW